MNAKIYPSNYHGSITIPSSKSYAHRLLILSSLFNKKTVIHNIDINNDVIATIETLNLLGAKIEVSDETIIVQGPIKPTNQKVVFDVKESGSTIRFLMPLISLLCKKPIIKTSGQLAKRPLNIFNKYIDFEIQNNLIVIKSTIKETSFEIDGSISSQFISGLIFYLIYLNIDADIQIVNDIVSKNYLLMTIEVAKSFGINITLNNNIITIKKHSIINNNDKFNEIDYSQAAFFMVLNEFKGNKINILNKTDTSLQGDFIIASLVKNCKNNDIIDLKNCPDLGPILICLYVSKKLSAKFINTDRLKIKESNRIQAMKENLHFFNYLLQEDLNSFTITPTKNKTNYDNIIINSFNDHRIIMSFAVLANILNQPITIKNAEFVKKSYPNFFNDLIRLGGKIDYYE